MINKFSVLNGAKYFLSNGIQNYLVLQLFISHFSTKNDKFYSLNLNRMSIESVTPPCTTDESFSPKVSYWSCLYDSKFTGICLKQNSVSFRYKNTVQLHITYELDAWSKDFNTNFTLGIAYLEL